ASPRHDRALPETETASCHLGRPGQAEGSDHADRGSHERCPFGLLQDCSMSFKVKRGLRIIVLVREGLVPPETIEGLTESEIQPWKTEYDVISTLRKMGHEVLPIGLYDDLGIIRKALEEKKPHLIFNLLEEFHGYAVYDQHVVSFLELMKQPYTGCNPRG